MPSTKQQDDKKRCVVLLEPGGFGTEEVESIFITPLPSTSGASTPHSSFDDCAVSAALLRASTTNKKKRKRQSSSQRVVKKSQNAPTQYFTSQK